MWITLAASLLLLPASRSLAGFTLIVAIGLAIFYGVVTTPALIFLSIVITFAFYRQKVSTSSWLRKSLELGLVLSACLLFFHWVPGFNNLKIIDQVKAGPLSLPFTLYFNFDKALIPFIFITLLPDLFAIQPVKRVSANAWLILVLSVPTLLLLAVPLEGLKIELHWPSWLVAFIFSNMFFVCMAEEALFRGCLQRRLSQRWGAYPALMVTAIIFGIVHLTGGPLLAVFAFLAGLIYGLAWMWSGKLWVAILFHFGLNMLHLLCFTYPLYQPLTFS